MSKKRTRRRKPSPANHSVLGQHKQQGKNLVPPLSQLHNMQLVSWVRERLPEFLWAILLVVHLSRKDALDVFRRVAKYMSELAEEDKFYDVTHTALSNLPSQQLDDVLSIITAAPEQKEVLLPLLLFNNLPGRKAWVRALDEDVGGLWEPLMAAVARALDHQSQESTDCRWLKLLCLGVTGKLRLQSQKQVDYILRYPDYGIMQMVRPFIRSAELAISAADPKPIEWAAKFWGECLAQTPCFPLNPGVTGDILSAGTTAQRLDEVYNLLAKHAYETRTTSDIDARHDTVLGVGLYSLGTLQELLRVGNSHSIIGRTALRTIVECYITLAYLAKKDNADLWQSYRVFGAGQSKLAFLKLEELGVKPSFVNVQMLEQLANEDMWLEFQPINLGHWEKTNLRQMSETADVKADYDQFYNWSSTFTHGHWGAVRDAAFDICGNPLHRLHRIPRQSVRALPDVIPDACQLVDKILDLVSQLYPEFLHRVSLKKVDDLAGMS